MKKETLNKLKSDAMSGVATAAGAAVVQVAGSMISEEAFAADHDVVDLEVLDDDVEEEVIEIDDIDEDVVEVADINDDLDDFVDTEDIEMLDSSDDDLDDFVPDDDFADELRELSGEISFRDGEFDSNMADNDFADDMDFDADFVNDANVDDFFS